MKFALSASLVLFLAPLAAHAGKVQSMPLPSGVTASYVKCNFKPNKCMKSAASHCKGAYQVLDSESHAGGLVADLMPGPTTWYSITFLCGKSNGAMPTFPFRGSDFIMPTIVIPQSTHVQCTSSGGFTNCYSY